VTPTRYGEDIFDVEPQNEEAHDEHPASTRGVPDAAYITAMLASLAVARSTTQRLQRELDALADRLKIAEEAPHGLTAEQEAAWAALQLYVTEQTAASNEQMTILESRIDALEEAPAPPASARPVLTATTTFYVNPTTGSDEAEGTEIAPFATVAGAMLAVQSRYEIAGITVVLRLAPGDYGAMPGRAGNTWSIEGDPTNHGLVTINATTYYSGPVRVQFRYLTFTTNAYRLHLTHGAVAMVRDCIIAGTGVVFYAARGGYLQLLGVLTFTSTAGTLIWGESASFSVECSAINYQVPINATLFRLRNTKGYLASSVVFTGTNTGKRADLNASVIESGTNETQVPGSGGSTYSNYGTWLTT
jgi:hypothetical protein